MRNLAIDLGAAGGIARTRSLVALGHPSRQLARAVAAGTIMRPRNGWVALPNADPVAQRAVQLGGRLAGASALVSHGIWVDDPPLLTVLVRPNAARLPALGAGERRIWIRERFEETSPRPWRVSVLDALLHYAHEASPDALLASVDSALHHGLITMDGLRRLCTFAPRRHQHLVREADGRAESGNETHLRSILRRAGLRVAIQVDVALVGRVDTLVDEWLIVEVDSHGHHGDPVAQDRDRIRDGNAVLIGCASLRFMPEAIREAPDWILEVVLSRMRDGRPVAPTPWLRPISG